MNGTDLQLVCYSTFWKQYIASMYYPYKTFVSFSLLYILRKYLIAFASFSMRHIVKILVTRASLLHHNGNQDVTKETIVTKVWGHAFHRGWFEAVLWAIFCLYTPESA